MKAQARPDLAAVAAAVTVDVAAAADPLALMFETFDSMVPLWYLEVLWTAPEGFVERSRLCSLRKAVGLDRACCACLLLLLAPGLQARDFVWLWSALSSSVYERRR